jgi:sugar-specific transcriptional regulator TrmB
LINAQLEWKNIFLNKNKTICYLLNRLAGLEYSSLNYTGFLIIKVTLKWCQYLLKFSSIDIKSHPEYIAEYSKIKVSIQEMINNLFHNIYISIEFYVLENKRFCETLIQLYELSTLDRGAYHDFQISMQTSLCDNHGQTTEDFTHLTDQVNGANIKFTDFIPYQNIPYKKTKPDEFKCYKLSLRSLIIGMPVKTKTHNFTNEEGRAMILYDAINEYVSLMNDMVTRGYLFLNYHIRRLITL